MLLFVNIQRLILLPSYYCHHNLYISNNLQTVKKECPENYNYRINISTLLKQFLCLIADKRCHQAHTQLISIS